MDDDDDDDCGWRERTITLSMLLMIGLTAV